MPDFAVSGGSDRPVFVVGQWYLTEFGQPLIQSFERDRLWSGALDSDRPLVTTRIPCKSTY